MHIVGKILLALLAIPISICIAITVPFALLAIFASMLLKTEDDPFRYGLWPIAIVLIIIGRIFD